MSTSPNQSAYQPSIYYSCPFPYYSDLATTYYWCFKQCSGVSPCSECTKRNCACVIDEHSDKRRNYHTAKIETELAYYKEFVDGIFMAMRTSSQSDLQQIIDAVRSGASTSEVQNLVTSVLAVNQYIQPNALIKAPDLDQGD